MDGESPPSNLSDRLPEPQGICASLCLVSAGCCLLFSPDQDAQGLLGWAPRQAYQDPVHLLGLGRA